MKLAGHQIVKLHISASLQVPSNPAAEDMTEVWYASAMLVPHDGCSVSGALHFCQHFEHAPSDQDIDRFVETLIALGAEIDREWFEKHKPKRHWPPQYAMSLDGKVVPTGRPSEQKV